MNTSRAVLIAVLAICFPVLLQAIPLCTPGMPVNEYMKPGLCAPTYEADDILFDIQAGATDYGAAPKGVIAFAEFSTGHELFGDSTVLSGPDGAGEPITLHQDVMEDTGFAAGSTFSEQISVNFLVPEPSTMLLLALGLLGLITRCARG